MQMRKDWQKIKLLSMQHSLFDCFESFGIYLLKVILQWRPTLWEVFQANRKDPPMREQLFELLKSQHLE
jgi:hypothetical protein